MHAANDVQGGAGVRRLERAVSAMLDQRDDELAVGRAVVDDEDERHQPPSVDSCRAGVTRARRSGGRYASTWPTKASGSMGFAR